MRCPGCITVRLDVTASVVGVDVEDIGLDHANSLADTRPREHFNLPSRREREPRCG